MSIDFDKDDTGWLILMKMKFIIKDADWLDDINPLSGAPTVKLFFCE